ncbi:unnamed protein product [Vicia faba]|uniref:Uncharacterized protein n=1 Tax=Vicia faba TaxID=3906 RepID=A0AAV1AVS3_VICFA|nr:unnamed protein product [Vicia faba]
MDLTPSINTASFNYIDPLNASSTMNLSTLRVIYSAMLSTSFNSDASDILPTMIYFSSNHHCGYYSPYSLDLASFDFLFTTSEWIYSDARLCSSYCVFFIPCLHRS